MVAYLPAAMLLLFAGWCGTFDGAVIGGRAVVGHLALLAAAAAAGSWRDPLALGRRGRWLVFIALAIVVACWLSSPVERAGRVAVLLLPAWLMVPAWVARCWADEEARRRGILATSAVVGIAAAWSLYGWWFLDTPGTSLPLGHHNLLAVWLLALLPIALLPLYHGGRGRAMAAVAGALAITALLATRSLAGTLGLAVEIVAGLALALGVARAARGSADGSTPVPRPRSKGVSWVALAVLAVGLTVAFVIHGPRLGRLAAGDDTSLRAREAYWQAASAAVVERPWLGWGPGAVPWTVAEHLRPLPAVHPADEVVGDLHSWPMQMLYETGGVGLVLVLVVAAAFVLRRAAELAVAGPVAGAGLVGLAGALAAGLGGLPWPVTALPMALAVAAGAARTGAAKEAAESTGRRRWNRGAWVLLLGAPLVPLDLAHLAYDRALDRDDPVTLLRRAVDLDPAFPLYRARLAWLEGSAEEARRAAEAGRGVAPLWLAAGVAGHDAGVGWSEAALVRACDLSPMGALAPFHLAVGAEGQTLATDWLARALIAEPRLLAATKPLPALAAALARIADAPGVDPFWAEELGKTASGCCPSGGEIRRLALVMDEVAAESVSLHTFRRRPWPTVVASANLDGAALPAVELVPAHELETTGAELYGPGCTVADRRATGASGGSESESQTSGGSRSNTS